MQKKPTVFFIYFLKPSGVEILHGSLMDCASLGHVMGEALQCPKAAHLSEMTGHKFHFYYDLFETASFL